MIPDDIVDLGLEPFSDDELSQLQALLADGTIRRFGAVVNHRRVGFAANALVLWQVPAEKLDAAGAALAAAPFVSHCYARAPQPGWPYTLYAMVHAMSKEALADQIRQLSASVEAAADGSPEHLVFETLKEYKKISMRYAK